MRRRTVVGIVVASSLVAGGAVWNFGVATVPVAGVFEAFDGSDFVDGPLGDSRLLGELCETSACVADLVVLPDLHPLEVAVDLPVAETLGGLSIERVWTGQGGGLFGNGWASPLDVAIEDGVISGPVGGRPVQPLGVGSLVDLSDGSQIEFIDGRPASMCAIGALCTDIEWASDHIRLTASSAEEHWVELGLVDGLVSTATAWDGRTVDFGYEAGRLVSAGDTAYSYEEGRLAAVDDGFVPRSFTYLGGNLVEATDRDRTTWTFLAVGDKVRVEATGSSQRSYSFDTDKRVTSIVDEQQGHLLSRTYVDAALVREERPLDGIVMTMVGPGLVEVEQTNDLAPSRQATYRYGRLGQLVETVDAGTSTTYRYDDRGLLVAESDAGGETRYEYDSLGLLASTIDPDGYRVEISRFPDGSISAIEDGETRTELDYDTLGRTVVQRDGLLESKALYGDRGELVATVDPSGARTDYVYDESGRLIDTESEFARFESSGQHPGGIEVLEIESQGDGTEYQYSDGSVIRYDEYGRPVEASTVAGFSEQRSYDSAGRLSKFTGFDGLTHELEYTAGGRVASLNLDGERYDFTWSGERLASVQGPLGLQLEYEWNPAGALASATANGMEWDYEYDDNGNLARVESPSGAIESTWDDGLPSALIGPDGAAQTIDWDDGRVASLLTGDDGFTFAYDGGGRLASVSAEDGDNLESYEYDEGGRLVAATLEDQDIEVRYNADGIDWVRVGDDIEFWSQSEGEVDGIRLNGRFYEIDWAAPGLVGEVSVDGETLVDVSADARGRITSISTDDEVIAEFDWDASGLAEISIDGDTAVVERNALGLTERYERGDFEYRADYDGLALRSVAAGDVEMRYELAGGHVVGSTFVGDEKTAVVDWDGGSRVQSFTSSEGAGSFSYEGAVVSEISYDSKNRTVEYNADGRPSAGGTGGEFLDDLFLDDGRPSLGASRPAVSPEIPALSNLPTDLGVSLPKPLTGRDVVDAALWVATPVVPTAIVAGGSDELVGRAIATALGSAGPVRLAVDPVRSVEIAPLGEPIDVSEILSAAPTFVVAASVLDRLGPDSSLLGRVFGGAEWTVNAVSDGLVSLARFSVNPFTIRAATVVLFLGANFAPQCRNPVARRGCNLAAHTLVNALASDSPSDFFDRALFAPVSSLLVSGINLDIDRWTAIVSVISIAARAPALRARLTVVGCGLKRVACLRQARFGDAAEHARDAVEAGRPRLLVVNRTGAMERRRDALRGIAMKIGMDRDEYPPAFARRDGQAVSVRLIDSSSNRSAGAFLQHQTSGLRDGARFFVVTI